ADSMTASAANGGGTKNHGRIGARLLDRFVDGVENRPALVRRPALPRRHTADDLRAGRLRLLRVERALPARKALHKLSRGVIDEYGHGCSDFAIWRSSELTSQPCPPPRPSSRRS